MVRPGDMTQPARENLDLDELPGSAPFIVTVEALRAFLRAGLDAAQTRQWSSGGLTLYAAARLSGRAGPTLLKAVRRGDLTAKRRADGTWSVSLPDLRDYMERTTPRSQRRRGRQSDSPPAIAIATPVAAEPPAQRRRRSDRMRAGAV